MAKVPSGARQAGRPQLKPEHAGGADVVVVEIAAVEFRSSQFRKEEQPVLSFAAPFEEYELRCGKRATDRLCEKFGDETNEWIGESIPLVKNREEVGSKTYIVYQVPPVEEWPSLLKAAKKATRPASRGK